MWGGSFGTIGLKLSLTKYLLHGNNLSYVGFCLLLLKLSLYGPGSKQIAGVFLEGGGL